MPLRNASLLSGLLLAASLPAQAQSAPSPPTEPAPAAANLVVEPRFGVNYQTGAGGFRDFGSAEALIPLGQLPGQDLWFLQGQARLDTVGGWGSTLLLGYRSLDAGQGRLVGGYLGIDVQEADRGTFYQLGAGFERLSQGLELRSNVYLPVGDRTTEATLTGTPFFQDYQLLLPTTRQVAMAGGDLSVGGAIADLGDLGLLKANGGLYYYGHPEVSGVLGGRAWLTMTPTPGLNLGLGLQHDGYFGTNVLLQTGFSWGGRQPTTNSGTVATALGAPVQRTMPIWTVSDSRTEAAQNPVSGQNYGFQHVVPAATGGDGAITSPYGDINAALAASQAEEIVYVRPGDLGAGFTIPDRVQVLSTAVEQPIATQVGTVALPESGSGIRPYVPGTVVLSNGNRLSGFTIEAGLAQDGVLANNISGVTLDNNDILTARNGISLNQVGGEIVVRQNRVQTASQNGILLNSGLRVSSAELSQNQVASAGENGLLVLAAGNSQIDRLALSQNQVQTAGENGIAVLAETNSRIGAVDLTQSQVGISGENGLILLADSSSTINQITLANAEVSNAGTNGVLVLADNGGRVGEVAVRDTAIAQSGANGILVRGDRGGQLGPVA
ncbi:MAG: right-handed parallel beta-helix repeat-containing protein, partial [Nodosilinea sp.]